MYNNCFGNGGSWILLVPHHPALRRLRGGGNCGCTCCCGNNSCGSNGSCKLQLRLQQQLQLRLQLLSQPLRTGRGGGVTAAACRK